MYQVVLVRHGESLWNKANRFTGWKDVDLSEKGVEEARRAGNILKQKGYEFDLAFTSVLKRAIKTLWLCLEEMDLMWIPVEKSWRLNERFYGALTGLNKAETAQKYGDEQVHIWRRSYDTPPPALDKSHEDYPGRDKRYKNLKDNEIPLTECLKDTLARVLPYWEDRIVPEIKEGKRILIAAHGNSLRALIKHMDGISDDEINQINIPTGIPLVYELDKDLKPIKSFYLASDEDLKAAQDAVENQGKAK